MYDIVIRAGTVVDGSGAQASVADVGIHQGRVVEVGRIDECGLSEIEAEGLVVSPGFIDLHTHLDAQVFWDAAATPASLHGVTTAVMGNCGFSLAPGSARDSDLVIRSIERAEDIPRDAIRSGVPWTWTTFADYLAALRARPKGINVGAYVGHSALRAHVMGARAFESTASVEEVEAMVSELRDALGAGALGFSTSRSHNHLTTDGHPVASKLADWGEVCRLVNAVGAVGGVFQISTEKPQDETAQAEFAERLRALAVGSGALTSFGVFTAKTLGDIERIAAEGGYPAGQVNVMGTTSIVLSFKTHLPFDHLPTWKRLRSLPLEEQARGFLDPQTRSDLVREALEGPYGDSVGAEVGRPDFDQIFVFDGRSRGPSLNALAASRGTSPIDVVLDLALETDFAQFFIYPLSSTPDDELVRRMRHPNTVIAGSDAGAHVSQIIDSSMPTHLLGHFVRERDLVPLEEAVRYLTAEPAEKWGIAERGRLAPGYAADIVVFDPSTIGPGELSVVHDLPNGSPRLMQGARGIHSVLVNGTPFIQDGDFTGNETGQVVHGRAYAGPAPR